MVAVSCLVLLPFVVLCLYVAPNLEDYAESIIPEVLWHVKFLYLSYDGRFFTSFLFAAVNPLKSENYILYQCLPLLLLAGLLFSFYQLSLSFISRSKKLAVLLSFLVLLVFLHKTPNLPYTLYYMISTYVYTVPSIIFLLIVSSSYNLVLSKKNNAYKLGLISCGIFAVAGGNELLLIPCLVWFIVLGFINKKMQAKRSREISLFFFSIVCSYFIVFTSPGVHENIQTLSLMEEVKLLTKALHKSIVFTLTNMKGWVWGNYSLYISSILFVVLVRAYNTSPYFKLSWFKSAVLVFILFGSILFVAFPYTWSAKSTASASYSQVFIVPCLFFTLVWFFSLFLIVSKLSSLPWARKPWLITTLSILLGLSFFLDKTSNVYIAFQDLVNREAQGYHAEIKENISKSQDKNALLNDLNQLELCELKHQPRSVYSGVYFRRELEHFHLEYRLYYKIKRIKVVPCS